MSKENAYDVRAKYRFVRRLLHHRFQRQPRVCPYCGPSSGLKRIRRKKLVMDILQCDVCHLIFRWPADTPQEHDVYYQRDYAGDSPQVVLPPPQELRGLMQTNFSGSPLDINHKIRVLRALRPSGRVLDLGCSWAYGTYQFAQQGYDASGFEISKRRAEYGRQQLHQKVIDSLDELYSLPSGSFDIIYSNHVVEHLPEIRTSFTQLARLLDKNGMVFHVLPNFTGKAGRSGLWLKWIGEDHPIAPTIPFFEYAIPASGLQPPTFGSNPFDEHLMEALLHQPGAAISTEGDELLVLAAKRG
jgi:2-polyprenyl-3-methyl-5-hydroxy-6-metoxy-1,4-benzoquinol methylase